MSDGKNHRFRPPLYHDGEPAPQAGPAEAPSAPDEKQGWEAYRKWLSRVSMQPARRSARDASIYSWHGYNSWADKVRQNWKGEDT